MENFHFQKSEKVSGAKPQNKLFFIHKKENALHWDKMEAKIIFISQSDNVYKNNSFTFLNLFFLSRKDSWVEKAAVYISNRC